MASEFLNASSDLSDIDSLALVLHKCLASLSLDSKKLSRLGLDYDDISQEAWIAFVKAMQTFDNSKGASFNTYANICIKNRILSFIKSSASKKRSPLNDSLSLDSEPGLSEDLCINFYNTDPVSFVISRETNQLIKLQISAILSEFELKTLKLYLNGFSYDSMAHRLSTSTKSIDNALQRIRTKLKSVDSFVS